MKTEISKGKEGKSLQKQIHLYYVDTSAFYTDKEKRVQNIKSTLHVYLTEWKETLKFVEKYRRENKLEEEEYENIKANIKKHIKRKNKQLKRIRAILNSLFNLNTDVRQLRSEALNLKSVVSMFDCALARTLKIEPFTLTNDIIIVRTYFFKVFESMILNGFIYNKQKYICLTASAGQIRNKKTIFVHEDLWKKHKNTLTCNMSVELINKKDGININKYLAYLALNNSATDIWEDFDIDKSIVVDDMEFSIETEVDYINHETYEINRQIMPIPIVHTDGCGMILPSESKKNFMVRLPWMKGLMTPFDFRKWILEMRKKTGNQRIGIVKDIYGKVEHDIIKEDILYVFTRSQFKLWMFYNSWDEYRENYKAYKCQASKCNEEEDVFTEAKLGYQMLQTLVDMQNSELMELSSKTRNDIINIGKDRETMLKVLGVTEANKNKNYFQQALEIYPELLSDTYSREVLKDVKKSMVKQARYGKIDINGKYTYIIPDLLAFCEWLFILSKEDRESGKKPKGLLENGEVFCRLYNQETKLDCLRNPHLYREHAIKINKINNKNNRKWFITRGLYTSVFDPITRLLMNDNDGDKVLVSPDNTLISVSERNMNGIVPLYYEMKSAKTEQITNESIYKSLVAAYTGGNIGDISNTITKIWNDSEIDLELIKFLCMENNFTIDYCKTLYKPKRPPEIKQRLSKYINNKTSKVPYFFIYAKDKDKDQVAPQNKSVVNRLNGKVDDKDVIPNPNIRFTASNLGKFNHKMLMNNKRISLDQQVIDKYGEFDSSKKRVMLSGTIFDEEISSSEHLYQYKVIRDSIVSAFPDKDINYIVDVLVHYLYKVKKSKHKLTLWSSFGDVIVENLKKNIKNNLEDGYICCEQCGERALLTKQRQTMCESCQMESIKEKARLRKQKERELKKNIVSR